jgi:hypothetical protein
MVDLVAPRESPPLSVRYLLLLKRGSIRRIGSSPVHSHYYRSACSSSTARARSASVGMV